MKTRRPISAIDFQRAFADLLPNMDRTKKRVLQTMMALPNQTASSQQLLKLLNLPGHIILVNSAIGQLGAQVYKKLGAHPEGWKAGEFQTWSVIAEQGEEIEAGFPWKLRSQVVQVVQALIALGFETEQVMPEELPAKQAYWEGARTVRFVNVYERSAMAREACIRKHGSRCIICKMDFGERYGKLLAGFIHVHHLVALAKVDARYEVNPILDLVPVCPNCHAVLHYGGELRSIEDVRKMIAAVSQPNRSTPLAPQTRQRA